MKLATSTSDFTRWYTNSNAKAVQSIQKTKFRYVNLDMGLDCEEIKGDTEQAVDSLREAAERAGITYSTAHSPVLNPFSGDREYYGYCVQVTRKAMEISGCLGIKRIVVHAAGSNRFTAGEFYRNNRDFYRELFDLMEKYEMTLMLENMADCSKTFLSTGMDVAEFADFIDHPLIGVCWDTAHGNLNEKARAKGQYRNIMAIGDKLKGLHIADNFGDGAHQHTFPFAGIINFDSVMQGLLDVSYDGFFTFEAAYTLPHHTNNNPYPRQSWEHNGKTVTSLLDAPVELKEKADDLLYDIGAYILKTYGCFEE